LKEAVKKVRKEGRGKGFIKRKTKLKGGFL